MNAGDAEKGIGVLRGFKEEWVILICKLSKFYN